MWLLMRMGVIVVRMSGGRRAAHVVRDEWRRLRL